MLINNYSYSKLSPLYPDEARTLNIRLAANQTLVAGTVLGQITAAAVNEVQTLAITGTPTGGVLGQLLISGVGITQTALPYNASAAQVQAALLAIPGVPAGAFVCAGGALPGTGITITFSGPYAGQAQQIIQIVGTALTGGSSPAVTNTRTTAGVSGQSGTPGTSNYVQGAYAPYNSANSDGTQTPRLLLEYPIATGPDGLVTLGSTPSGNEKGNKELSASAYHKGSFRTTDLVGLDAGALSGFARLVSGVYNDGVITLL